MPQLNSNDKCDTEKEFTNAGENKNPIYGLSTRVALSRLHDEIEKILITYERKFASESCYQKLRSTFMKRYDSPLGWFSIFISLLIALILLVGEFYFSAACLTSVLILDLYIVIRENNLRRTEIYRKTRNILSEIRLAEQDLCNEWRPFNYAHLHIPLSPCVSLQWTYRDGVVVNLPWALLVRGDHIVLRPGHVAPGNCTETYGKKTFKANEIYGVTHIQDPPVKPIARSPLPELICTLENTPFLDNLLITLESFNKRPPTIYNQQRYLLVTKYIQQWGVICAASITLFSFLLRMLGIISSNNGEYDEKQKWKNQLVETVAASTIPLLPLVFPIMWIAMNLWGVARLQCFLKSPQMCTPLKTEKSFEEDLDAPNFDYVNVLIIRSTVFTLWRKLWKGDSELLPRSSNVVQVLGSITALCCVDKKGILSWPNPTAEKVFFLHDTEEELEERSNSQSTLSSENDEPIVNNESKDDGIAAEVLDLTHDQHCPFRLEFDDHEWKAHIKSLKPLGLAILLNTCSSQTHAHYAKFCGHVTAVAMLDKDLVPVTNRRCLCELAKQIGFTDHATDRFNLEGQLASYRHLQPDVVRRDIRFARQLQLSSKLKVPFPHSLSVVMRENPGGYLSLFTQGTADIILDFCDDFWDGKDLRPLSQQDRKRAIDFYQRSALTAYCTAFAYRPLRHGINGALSGSIKASGPIAYLELPPEAKIRMQHVDKIHCDFEGGHAKLSHSISTDSLLFSESKDDDINDVEGCFETQCHQVFIGMVTMQYQAQTDIVQLVEHLERACIRFVHFSKENELRSRVFSEKMGLESGWNCHISLLSETNDISSTKTGLTLQSPKHTGNNELINIVTSINASPTSNQSNILTNTRTNDTNPLNLTTTTTTSTNRSLIPHIVDITNIHNKTHAKITATNQSHTHSPNTRNVAGSGNEDDCDLNYLLPPANLESSKALSSSAPGAISNNDYKTLSTDFENSNLENTSNASLAGSKESLDLIESKNVTVRTIHQSQDSVLDENCRSLSIITESTEQSAPVHFDMSNRAKLPRGIENIRPHLEKVDNVPLQVSLFTDCSAEATCQMLDIMQSYGEIVVCLGSSASNMNAKTFLQADCSIGVEPLYPQVCQEIPAYTEDNIKNNKMHRHKHNKKTRQKENGDRSEGLAAEDLLSGIECGCCLTPSHGNTISPIYISRLLNSLPCSIAICREDPISLVAIIELSRRFSAGLWNSIQYWACCAASLSMVNIFSACLSLPPILSPLASIYLMCIPLPLIALSLAHIDIDPKIMNRATGKKQTEYDSRAFGFVLWCYGLKFVSPVLFTVLTYCAFMAHPIEWITEFNEDKFHINLHISRIFSLLGILIHFVVVSASFVHRDHSLWQRNPFRNRIWTLTCLSVLLLHSFVCGGQVAFGSEVLREVPEIWPAIVFLYCGSLISLLVTEVTKWQEIKVNSRYQRRARLDFGTKLGMNSPF